VLLLATLRLAIDCADNLEELAGWWQAHQPAIRHLSERDRATLIAAKDARKREWETPHAPRHATQRQPALF